MVTKLSLICTAYNSEQYLHQFKQMMKEISHLFDEVIIVDDCSTDGSFNDLRDYANKFNFLIYQTDSNTGRPSTPRNIGIQKSSNSRVVFLDIDDLLPKTYIKFLTQIDINDYSIYSGTKLAVPLEKYNFSYHCNFQKYKKITLENFNSKNLICFSGSSINKNILKGLQFKNTPLEDHIFWREFIKNNTNMDVVKFLDVPIGYSQVLSLSPIKTKQIARIYKMIGISNMPMYFINTIWLRLMELNLKKRYYKS